MLLNFDFKNHVYSYVISQLLRMRQRARCETYNTLQVNKKSHKSSIKCESYDGCYKRGVPGRPADVRLCTS